MTTPKLTLLALLATVTAVAQQAAPRVTAAIDAGRAIGAIRPLHDLDNGPLCARGIVDLTRFYKELGIRYVRLHDVPYTYDDASDVNYVFPHWDADPDNPANYEFGQTDFHLAAISSLGIKVINRLGYSIDYRTPVSHATPPPSYERFAAICKRIIAHHNEGWANGQHANIEYWEIWNEPDIRVFWTGTPEQFYRLYVETAKALKQAYPKIKIGGPALAGNLGFLDGMLKYCQEQKAPVDFVSWHIYTRDYRAVARTAQAVRRTMTHWGYGSAESILDEWNYGPKDWNKLFSDVAAAKEYFDSTQNEVGAAFDAAVLTSLQDAPVDIATFYSGTTFMWGMFTSSGVPLKPYYAFLAFRRMLDTPKRLSISLDGGMGMTALAGMSDDQKMLRVLIANTSPQAAKLELQFKDLPWNSRSV
jgi:xylan 1,4-beta-xylosidase